MPDNTVHELVESQFRRASAAYLTSPTHSDGKSLAALVELVKPVSSDRVLDVATGAGHTALAFAPHVQSVVAYDLTEEMLKLTEGHAKDRGLENVSTRQGKAEQLPFEDGAFTLVTVRTAPHHFQSVEAFLEESYRVLQAGGKLLVVDTTAPEDATVAEELNRVEKLRDPSHGRNLPPSEWEELVTRAGFSVVNIEVGQHACGKKMEIHDWMDRMQTSDVNRHEVLGVFQNATPELVEVLDIERKGDKIWFTLPELTLLAVK